MALVKVIEAKHIGNYELSLKFNTGEVGVVDLEAELYGTIFEPLKNIEFFKKFELDPWTVTWPNGADFAPEFLYDEALKQNKDRSETVDG